MKSRGISNIITTIGLITITLIISLTILLTLKPDLFFSFRSFSIEKVHYFQNGYCEVFIKNLGTVAITKVEINDSIRNYSPHAPPFNSGELFKVYGSLKSKNPGSEVTIKLTIYFADGTNTIRYITTIVIPGNP